MMIFALHAEGWVAISQVEADGGGGEEALITWVQLMGQLVVMSF